MEKQQEDKRHDLPLDDRLCLSSNRIGLRTLALFVSMMRPLITCQHLVNSERDPTSQTISSRMKCALSRLNIICMSKNRSSRQEPPLRTSSSQTFSKYLSRVSTRAWINSRIDSSFYKIIQQRSWPGLAVTDLLIAHSHYEEKGRIAAVDTLVGLILQKRTLFATWPSWQDFRATERT